MEAISAMKVVDLDLVEKTVTTFRLMGVVVLQIIIRVISRITHTAKTTIKTF